MHKFWLIVKHEYLLRVRRRTFVIGTLGVPLFFIALMVIIVLVAVQSEDVRPVAYLDPAGILAGASQPAAENTVAIRPLPDEAEARAALTGGTLQAYFSLPADYLETHSVSIYYWDRAPDGSVRTDIDNFLREQLTTGLPADVRRRVLDGSNLVLRSTSGRQLSGSEGINLLLPGLVGVFLLIALSTSANYLLQALSDEKENRTIEIMVTSLTPEQLIGGKALGLIGVALTQMFIWATAAVAIILFGAQYLDFLKALSVPWDFALVTVAFFVPSYALAAGLMIAIGGVVNEARQGQQIAGIGNLLFTLPLFFIIILFTNADHPLLVGMTLFPTTALMTIVMRWGLTAIPAWQLIASWFILTLTAGLSVWAAARIFRAGMLRYGQRLDLRTVRIAAHKKREAS